MNDLKYTFLYSSVGVLTHIDDAIKGEYYFLFFDNETEYIVRHGLVNRKHYALKNDIGGGGGYGESAEHYNAKMAIVYNKKYFDTIFKEFIEFDEVKPEKRQENKIPDLSCYIDGNLVMAIEIYSTNKKTEDDIIELKKLNIPVIEIDINNENKVEHLILPASLEANRQKYSELIEQYKNVKQRLKYSAGVDEENVYSIVRQDDEGTYGFETSGIPDLIGKIESIESRIREQQREIEGFTERDYPDYRKFSLRISGTEHEIRTIPEDIERVKKDIRFIEREIEGFRK